ncbi:MAG: SDR family oxidoreductase [Candidatus Latescibacteria bacterium]|nr:SDR family oxidoreductase [Candidatus Latescibacterota bacterium]
MFDFTGKTAVITGLGGALGGHIATALFKAGAQVALWDIAPEAAQRQAQSMDPEGSGRTLPLACDAISKDSVGQALEQTLERFESVDLLVNAAGGSHPSTTTNEELTFFDIKSDDIRFVMDLNYLATVIPCQAVGRVFAQQNSGAVVNITSIGGSAPLSRALAYSNGKGAADNFTRWLAVHMAQEYDPAIRVNAIAPGFMLTQQNRFLLVDEDSGDLTARGQSILGSVPMARFGEPPEVVGAVLWLLSDQATFVTGAIVPIDGGYTAFAGV